MTTEYEVRLTALAYGGDSLGRLPDGRAVFVPFAFPGERVRVRILDEKRGYVRAELVEIIETSPGRIRPVNASTPNPLRSIVLDAFGSALTRATTN